jgi:hypothetical protein
MKKIVYIILMTMGICLSAHSQTTNHKVYSLFVLNIVKYTSFPVTAGDFNIVVIGKSEVYDEMVKMSAAKLVNGKKIVVTKADDVTGLAEVQVVFLSDSKSGSLSDVIKKFDGKSVMIITEREGLYKKGAGLSFVISEDSKLRVDINKTDLEKRQVRISQNVFSSLAHTVI